MGGEQYTAPLVLMAFSLPVRYYECVVVAHRAPPPSCAVASVVIVELITVYRWGFTVTVANRQYEMDR
jgi:hypothetical protein